MTDVTVEQAVPDARVQLGQPDKLDTQGGLESQAPSALLDEPGKQAPQVNVQLYIGLAIKKYLET